jgi:hypothetical protein
MSFIKKYLNKPDKYKEPLHILLYSYPHGLSSVDIADQLQISDDQCQELLKIEQIRNAIEVDPFSGTLIYKTKRQIQPNKTFSEALQEVKESDKIKFSLADLKFILLGLTIPVIIIIKISINVFISHIEKVPQIVINQPYSQDLTDKRVEAELASQKKIELEKERDDLNKRIEHLQDIAKKNNCLKLWIERDQCYLEGRLMTQEKFDKEIAQMKLDVTKINEILAVYSK